MKQRLCFVLCFMILVFTSVYSQNLYEEKYLIQLPDSWKNKPKVLIKVADVLKSNVPLLSNKQETFIGKSKYRVAIFLTSPVIDNVTPIANSSNVIVKFRFCSYFNIYNEKDQIVHRLIIVDSSETQSKTVYDPNYSASYRTDVIKPRNADILKSIPSMDDVNLHYRDDINSYNKKQVLTASLKRELLWNIVMRSIMKAKINSDLKDEE
jgi:hypothetical protein